ncbi:MAG: beta-mannanase [Planctomycetes bacterium]|nr:beta-mannanase [Planctomycetota bacterium]
MIALVAACEGGGDGGSGSSTPSPRKIYHGVTPDRWATWKWPAEGGAQAISDDLTAYEAAAGRTVAWAAFANEWELEGAGFPAAVATAIRARGAMPFIYLTFRRSAVPEPQVYLDLILNGDFDADIAAWAEQATDFGSRIIVDWGWEMNITDAPWNGTHNGGAGQGPQRYRAAFRHIVELMRSRGADNIHWAFHANFPEFPAEDWNAFENYYPGDDVVDSVGVSIYGAQSPIDATVPSFVALMDVAYPRLRAMAPSKPVMVYEFGSTAGHPQRTAESWADEALTGIFSGRWPEVRGFAWWNETWTNEYSPDDPTEMRLEVLPNLALAFRSHLVGSSSLGDRPSTPMSLLGPP